MDRLAVFMDIRTGDQSIIRPPFIYRFKAGFHFLGSHKPQIPSWLPSVLKSSTKSAASSECALPFNTRYRINYLLFRLPSGASAITSTCSAMLAASVAYTIPASALEAATWFKTSVTLVPKLTLS